MRYAAHPSWERHHLAAMSPFYVDEAELRGYITGPTGFKQAAMAWGQYCSGNWDDRSPDEWTPLDHEGDPYTAEE